MRALNKSSNHHPNKKTVFLIAIIAIALLGTLLFILNRESLLRTKNNNDTNINLSEPSTDQKDAGIEIKRENNTPLNSAKNDNDQQATETPGSSSAKQSIPVTISYVNQDSNGTLNVRAIVSTIQEDSKCTIIINKDGSDIYTQTVDTFPQSSYTACGGFNINKDTLSEATGTVVVTVKYTSDTYEGIATKEATIK